MSEFQKQEEKDTFVESLEKLENWEPFSYMKYELATIAIANLESKLI